MRKLRIVVLIALFAVVVGCTTTQTITVRKDGVVKEITITRKGWNVVDISVVEE